MADDLDPRYDPAFQRGFAPAGDLVPAPPVTRAEPAPARAEPPARAETARSAPAGEGGVPDEPRPDPVGAPGIRSELRNPFLVAAAVLGLGLVVGGLWSFGQLEGLLQAQSTGQGLTPYLPEIVIIGAPMAIGAGVLILAGLLIFLAAVWRNRAVA